MHNPPHPGLIIKEDILPALGLGVTEAAHQLGITPTALTHVMSGRSTISLDIALRIEKWLGIKSGGAADIWLSQQAKYDQWQTSGRAS